MTLKERAPTSENPGPFGCAQGRLWGPGDSERAGFPARFFCHGNNFCSSPYGCSRHGLPNWHRRTPKPESGFITRASTVLNVAREAEMTIILVQVGFRRDLPEVS